MNSSVARCAFLAMFASSAVAHAELDERNTSVGMPARIEQLILPGSELVAKPIDAATPVVLRIVASYPHGTAFRYDIEYYGLEPGEYDLRDYLQRKDGTAMDDVPALKVQIDPVLPPGQIEPNPLETRLLPKLGGYRVLATVLGAGWVVGLLFILFYRRRKATDEEVEGAETLSLAERLEPLVKQAIAGTLTKPQRAELERMLLSHWRSRLGLAETEAAKAIIELKQHPEAGALLLQLERWLHQPESRREHVDVAQLLEPYRTVDAQIRA